MCWTGNGTLSFGPAKAPPVAPNALWRGRRHAFQKSKVGYESKMHRLLKLCPPSFACPRQTRAAAAELAALEEITEDIALSSCPDDRKCKLEAQDGILRAGPVYHAALLQAQSVGACTLYNFVWQNKAPPRVRFFVWLLVFKRRSNAKPIC